MELICIENDTKEVGKTFSSTKKEFTWIFTYQLKPVEIKATQSKFTQKKKIYVDNFIVFDKVKITGFQFKYIFEKSYELLFIQKTISDDIQLYINGELFQKLLKLQESMLYDSEQIQKEITQIKEGKKIKRNHINEIQINKPKSKFPCFEGFDDFTNFQQNKSRNNEQQNNQQSNIDLNIGQEENIQKFDMDSINFDSKPIKVTGKQRSNYNSNQMQPIQQQNKQKIEQNNCTQNMQQYQMNQKVIDNYNKNFDNDYDLI